MPLVTMPDGQLVDMPDVLSAEQKAALQAKANSGGVWDTVKESVKDLARGAMKGLGSLAEGAANTGITNSAVDLLGLPKPKGMDAAPVQAAVEHVLPTPPGDSYRRAGLEGLGGALATGPASAVTAAAGLTGGLAGEFGKRQAGLPGQIVGNLVGGVAGGGAAALATRVRPQSAAVAREALEGFTEAEFRDAQALMNKLTSQGTPVDLSQALYATTGRTGNITSIRDSLANRSQGNKVQDMLHQQPATLQREGQMTAAGLPGRDIPPLQAANNIQETATGVINQAKTARTTLWEDTVKQATNALRASEGVKVGQAQDFAKQTGLSLGEARGKVAELLKQLQTSQGSDAAAVKVANQKLAESQDLIERLSSFALPRGTTATNAGSFSTTPARGQSIINDSITRGVQAGSLKNSLPPPVALAPSLQTLSAEKALTAAQQAEQAALSANSQARGGVKSALEQQAATSRIPQQTLEGMDARLQDLIKSHAPASHEAQQLSSLRQALQTPEGPLTDPAKINKILSQFTDSLASPNLKMSGVSSGVTKYLGNVVTDIREQLGQGFDPIRKANDAFRQNTKEVIEPLRQGPIGLLAQPHGYDPAVQASMTKFDGLMRAGTESGAKVSEIRTAIKELAKVDNTAAEDAFKGWVRRSIDKATDTPVTPGAPSTNADMAQRVYENLFKDKNRWQGVKDAVAGISEARGQNPADVIKGLENYRQLTLAATSRPAKMEGLSASDLSSLGGNSALANAVRIFSFLPANQVGKAIEKSTLGKTFSEFDSILTSRDGADRLIKLGKVPVMSNAAQIMFATLGAGLGNAPALPNSNPPE